MIENYQYQFFFFIKRIQASLYSLKESSSSLKSGKFIVTKFRVNLIKPPVYIVTLPQEERQEVSLHINFYPLELMNRIHHIV